MRGRITISDHEEGGRRGWVATVKAEGVTVDVILFADAPTEPEAASLCIALRKDPQSPTPTMASLIAKGPRCIAVICADWTLMHRGLAIGPKPADVVELFAQALTGARAMTLRGPVLARFALLIAAGVDRDRASELTQAVLRA